MSRFRTSLIWLCCALVLCTGAPLRASSPCEDPGAGQPATPSCCGTERCHCADMTQAGDCDCSGRRAPERAPQAPAPRPQLAPAPELMPRLQELPAMAPPRVEPLDRDAPRSCAIPSRSRQEVFSVWRC